MKILVTGADGQLGREIKKLTFLSKENQYYFTTKVNLDINDPDLITKFIKEFNIELIINCAAYTKVEEAENNPSLADQVNHIAVKNLSNIAKTLNIFLIHLSTDYVFDGKTTVPYKENSSTNPLSVYGLTKLKGEESLLRIKPKGIIIRTCWLYSTYGNNFLNTILNKANEENSIKVVSDQIGTPTYAGELAKAIIKIINSKVFFSLSETELFHFSNKGQASWYEFANTIISNSNSNCFVEAVTVNSYPSKVSRPQYSVLDLNKIERVFNLKIPNWDESLRTCLTSNS